MEDKKQDFEAEIVDELEHEVEDLENEFESVKDQKAPETVREKQQQVQNILEEVHDQLNFLREVAEEGKD